MVVYLGQMVSILKRKNSTVGHFDDQYVFILLNKGYTVLDPEWY